MKPSPDNHVFESNVEFTWTTNTYSIDYSNGSFSNALALAPQMHRANLCKDLLGETLSLPGPNKEATLRALYVWMRYSAVRAITWQRNYNTQPRCVSRASHAPRHVSSPTSAL